MKHIYYISLLLGIAASLSAQTLSFGEITLVTPGTSNAQPVYQVNVILTSGSTLTTQCAATAPSCLAGLQFDLGYTAANFTTATLGLGASATTANADLNFTTLPAANNPWITNPPAHPNGNPQGQRAIIIGCCGTSQSTPTSNTITDGVVATFNVQAAAAPTAAGVYTVSLLNLMGTSAGGNNTAATAIGLSIAAGPGDPQGTGTIDLFGLYLVGGVYPGNTDSATVSPSFGTGKITLNDVLSVLFAFDGLQISGFPNPVCGTDRFDAMDTYPQDTIASRGGTRTGILTLNSVLTALFAFDKLTGYTTLPVRISAPYTCPVPGGGSAPAGTATAKAVVRTPPEVMATLVFGRAEGAGTGSDRIPVYLESRRDMTRLAITFGAGDQQSKWQFQTASAVAPSVLQDSTTGVTGALAVAWLQGLDIRAGQRLLLGYVVGPAGSAANLRVLGRGASLLDGLQEVGLEVSGVTVMQR